MLRNLSAQPLETEPEQPGLAGGCGWAGHADSCTQEATPDSGGTQSARTGGSQLPRVERQTCQLHIPKHTWDPGECPDLLPVKGSKHARRSNYCQIIEDFKKSLARRWRSRGALPGEINSPCQRGFRFLPPGGVRKEMDAQNPGLQSGGRCWPRFKQKPHHPLQQLPASHSLPLALRVRQESPAQSAFPRNAHAVGF